MKLTHKIDIEMHLQLSQDQGHKVKGQGLVEDYLDLPNGIYFEKTHKNCAK